MPSHQVSKLLTSRDSWKKKACIRSGEIREHRKRDKRHLQSIAKLKEQVSQLNAEVEEQKKR